MIHFRSLFSFATLTNGRSCVHHLYIICPLDTAIQQHEDRVKPVQEDLSWDHTKVVILDRWSSYKTLYKIITNKLWLFLAGR